MSIAKDLSFIIHIEGKLLLSLKDSYLVKNNKIQKDSTMYEVTTGKMLFLVEQLRLALLSPCSRRYSPSLLNYSLNLCRKTRALRCI